MDKTPQSRPLLLIGVVSLMSMAGLCSKGAGEFQVKVQNHSKADLSCTIRLNKKVDLQSLSLAPGATTAVPIRLSKIRETLKNLNQSTGALHLNCQGLANPESIELFGYIEPADNYLSGKVIVAEFRDGSGAQVSIHE